MLGDDFDRALVYASHVHGGDVRKGTTIPYMSHLMSVSALVLEAGASETQAIAALQHDVAEDFGGEGRLDDVRHRFGPEVADIVEACSDSLAADPTQKAPWRQRKEQYVAHLTKEGPADALLVSLADKLHNARSIARDQQELGDALFSRFTAGKHDAEAGREATQWYYAELLEVFEARTEDLPSGARPLVRELRAVVDAIKRHPSQPTN